jgi:eukaryotic-like serine/threonine-protein kinase
MRLPAGTRVGHYEIVSVLGVGGMGEVYRAHDTKLRRDVALKVLPAAFAHDKDRMIRFEREAHVLASLSHPNIASIFGIEDSGDTRALVMEVVEGPSLSDRIKIGPLPFEEAIEIAKQIADAFEYAHDHGVIHRDLKPANVKITPDDVVKVLDFGLAKAFTGELSAASGSVGGGAEASPTLTLRATQAGMILGTAAYMAPEQAKGKPVDRRADIWAFGVVMFEMLTGQPLFTGDTAAEIMASAIKEEPKLEKLPASTPSAIRRLIERCLQKDPRQRLQAIGEARIILGGPMQEEPAPQKAMATAVPSKARFALVPWALASVLFLALAALAFTHYRETPSLQSLRFQIPPPGAALPQHFTLSGDGRKLAFVATAGGPTQIWIRAMDALESRPLAGTEGATYPFWSPDGAYLGFFADGKLKKVAVAGGPSQTLCDASTGRGGTWNREGVIVFSPGPASSLFRVPAAGGNPVPVTKIAAGSAAAGDRFPSFLPDGTHFLYLAGSDKANLSGLNVGSLDGAAATRLLTDPTNALYAPPPPGVANGHLLFRREDTLMAQPFDPKSMKMVGDVFPIAEHVPISMNTGFGAFSVAGNGTLVYRAGNEAVSRELAWLDRSGKRGGVVGKSGEKAQASISPNEKTVAVAIGSSTRSDIWLQDLQRDIITRFTFRPGASFSPVWSPDASYLAFTLGAGTTYGWDIIRKSLSGNGQEDLLVHAGLNASPDDWSPDGKTIVYQQGGQNTGFDLWLLPLDANRKPVPYLQTQFNEENAQFSPDGKWMAYDSDESGQTQVYIQAVPPNGSKWQVSNAGGLQPTWRRDGKELFYISTDDKLMAAPIKLGSTVAPGTPQFLFDVASFKQPAVGISYSVSRDGQRFLLSAPAGNQGTAGVPSITVVTNWQPSLNK